MHDRLTDFDREVLAILLTHGGWNASSREQLAITARRYDVTAAGLARVVAGLAQAAGEGRLPSSLPPAGASSRPRRVDTARTLGGADGAATGRAAGAGGATGAAGAVDMVGMNGASTGLLAPHAEAHALSHGDRILLVIVTALLVVSLGLASILGYLLLSGFVPAFAGTPTSAGDTSTTATDAPAPGPDASAARDHAPAGAGAPRPTPVGTAGRSSADAGTTRADATGASNERKDGGAPAPSTAAGASSGAARRSALARPPAVPAPYPTVPGFRATLEAPVFMQALAEARAAGSRLDEFSRDPRSVLSSPQQWAALARSIGASWPRLDPTLRRSLVERTVAVFRTVDDAVLMDALLDPYRRAIGAAPTTPLEIRAGAWSAGVIGALLSEPGLSPEVVHALGATRLAPADGSGGSFDRFASGWLDRSLDAIVDQIGRDAPQEDFDRAEAWIEAQENVRSQAEVNEAWLRAVDAMLRRPLRIDLPGTPADLFGRYLALVDWRNAPPASGAFRRRAEQWHIDPAIDSRRLWALGSIVRQGRFAAWFAPDMVVGERAPMNDRREILDRILATLESSADDAPRAGRAPRELVERHAALVARVRDAKLGGDGVGGAGAGADGQGPSLGAAASAASEPARRALEHAVEIERLAGLGVIGALLLEGRGVEAAQRLSAFETALTRPALAGLGPAGKSLAIASGTATDGQLGRRLDQAKSVEERIDIVRRRRLEASNDLGPLDAARLVREAYQGEPSGLRLTAQGVIVDSFASGPRVAQELVDQFGVASAPDLSLAKFVERLTGARLPPHTNAQFRSRALAALLGHRLKLVEHPWHGVAALVDRAAALAAERLEIEGGVSESLLDAKDPSASIDALGLLLRARAETRPVPRAVPAPLAELDRRDAARRALAAGTAQRVAAAAWRVFELECFVAAADRPSLASEIEALVGRAVAEASSARSVLEQTLAIERARAALQSMLLEPPKGGST